MGDNGGHEQRSKASHGSIASSDDPSDDGLADEESEDVSAGLSDECDPSAVAFGEDTDAEGTGGDIEEDAEQSEPWAEGDGDENNGQGLQ